MAGKNETKGRKPMGRPKGKPRTVAEIAADVMRTGRPTLSPDGKGSIGVTMRLTPRDYGIFVRDAKRAGMGLAAFLRHCWHTAKEKGHGNDIQGSPKANRSGDRKKDGQNRR